MKVIVLYQPKSEHARVVEEFMHDFLNRQPQANIVLMDADSIEGAEKVKLYDVTVYPTILALAEDGQLLKDWQTTMPLMDEVIYYTVAGT